MRNTKRPWLWLACLALAAIAAALGPVGSALRIGAGTAAHNLCSSTFVSGLPERQTQDQLVGLLLGPARHLLRVRVDHDDRSAEAWLLFGHARAEFTPGYGCRLALGPATALEPLPPPPSAPDDGFAPPTLVQPANPALAQALDRLFATAPDEVPRQVKAVVIVKDGHVVAERYADGFGIDTPVMSFSVAKSVTNALLGILTRQGRLRMLAPAPVPEWSAPGDPRGRILTDQLLRMASGLDAAETGSGFDPASRMFYDSNDMAGYSARRPATKPPGTVWEYTSDNTLILDRIIGRIVGGGPAGLRQFAQRELFEPIGMNPVTLEFDGAGTFIGASHVYAPARAFARFGLLYLNDGVAPDGRRILPPGWVAYSRRSTAGSTYGAGFWTNDGPSEQAAWRVAQGFPKDGYFASGNLGQRIYIIPSERMVIARFGYSRAPSFGMRADLDLMREAIAALKD
jgi:CubicO group peptidase (beta-lactamase class C family)